MNTTAAKRLPNNVTVHTIAAGHAEVRYEGRYVGTVRKHRSGWRGTTWRGEDTMFSAPTRHEAVHDLWNLVNR